MKSITCLLLLGALVSMVRSQSCAGYTPPAGSSQAKVGSRCFSLVANGDLTWENAAAACGRANAKLASITSSTVETAIQGLLAGATLKNNGAWIGLQWNLNNTAGWKWADGTVADPNLGAFTKWAPLEEVFWAPFEPCGVVKSDAEYQWSSALCTLGTRYAYICEFKEAQTLANVRKQDAGDICQTQDASLRFFYQADGPYNFFKTELYRYDAARQNPAFVYSIDANGNVKYGSGYSGRVSSRLISGPNTAYALGTGDYLREFALRNVQKSDTGEYGAGIRYNEFASSDPNAGLSKSITSALNDNGLVKLTALTPPGTNFVFTVCKRASSPVCKSVGATETTKTYSFKAFAISSTAESFRALCTDPADKGSPAGVLEIYLTSNSRELVLENDFVFPGFIQVERTVKQMMDAIPSGGSQTDVVVSCRLKTAATTCLNTPTTAIKSIRIAAAGSLAKLGLTVTLVIAAVAKFFF